MTVTGPGGTSAATAADRYAYVNPVARVPAAGQFTVNGTKAEFGMAAGSTSGGNATINGTATVTVGVQLPLSLPATAVLTGSGLQLTIAGVRLPVLPAGTGSIEIG